MTSPRSARPCAGDGAGAESRGARGVGARARAVAVSPRAAPEMLGCSYEQIRRARAGASRFARRGRVHPRRRGGRIREARGRRDQHAGDRARGGALASDVTAFCPKPGTRAQIDAARAAAPRVAAAQAQRAQTLITGMPPALEQQVLDLVKQGQKIAAIRHYEREAGVDLTTAKDVVDRLIEPGR